MSERFFTRREMLGACLSLGLLAVGCRQKPEVPLSELGETIDHVPIIEDLPASFPIADEMETEKDCAFRRSSERNARINMYRSQGRTEEADALVLEQ